MVMGEMTQTTDVVVIGSGPGGYTAAIRAAQLGKKVIVVEKFETGGICLNHGCIPAKALIEVSDKAYKAGNSERLGINAQVKIDFAKMQAWKNSVIKKLTAGVEFLFKNYGIELLKGEAFFESSNRIKVAVEHAVSAIEFNKCIIAVGVKPATLKGFEIGKGNIISSKEALQLSEIPKSLLIIGSDYIAVELANIFAKLGSIVTIATKDEKLLKELDDDISEIIKKKLEEFGVVIKLKSDTAKEKADKIVVSNGFVADLKSLRLNNTKVEFDERGFIKVNEKCQTTDHRIYAVGDVTGEPLFAHKAYRQAKVAAEAIKGEASAFDNMVVPSVIYGEPEIGVVGYSEKTAEEEGKEIVVGKFPYSASGRAGTLNVRDGFVKVIGDKKSQVLLGMQIVGPNATDMISEGALAIEMGATLYDLASTIHPHPTVAEAIMEAAEVALGKAIHVPKKK